MTTPQLTASDLVGDFTSNGRLFTTHPLDRTQLEATIAIEQQSHSHPWSRQLFEDCLGSRQLCLLIQHQQTLVGFFVVSAAAGSAELLNIAVSPKWQRQGIAYGALAYLCKVLRNGYADTLYLEVRASNYGAIALYHQLEFVEVGMRPNYYPAATGREDAIIMACPF